jgi:nitrate reductase alpha subunit
VTSTRQGDTHTGGTRHEAGFDSGISEALVGTSRYFRKGAVSGDRRAL